MILNYVKGRIQKALLAIIQFYLHFRTFSGMLGLKSDKSTGFQRGCPLIFQWHINLGVISITKKR